MPAGVISTPSVSSSKLIRDSRIHRGHVFSSSKELVRSSVLISTPIRSSNSPNRLSSSASNSPSGCMRPNATRVNEHRPLICTSAAGYPRVRGSMRACQNNRRNYSCMKRQTIGINSKYLNYL